MRKVYLVPQEFEENINDIGVKITNIDSTAGYVEIDNSHYINYSFDGITWESTYEWITIDGVSKLCIPTQLQSGQSVYLKAASSYTDVGYTNAYINPQFKFNIEGDIVYLYEPNGI